MSFQIIDKAFGIHYPTIDWPNLSRQFFKLHQDIFLFGVGAKIIGHQEIFEVHYAKYGYCARCGKSIFRLALEVHQALFAVVWVGNYFDRSALKPAYGISSLI